MLIKSVSIPNLKNHTDKSPIYPIDDFAQPSNLDIYEHHRIQGGISSFQTAIVHRAIDGDTIELTNRRRVRLIGINTPESTYKIERYGIEAKSYTEKKLAGRKVWLEKDVSEYDRYGRLLRIVWLAQPEDDCVEAEIRTKMFNAELLLKGYAEPSTFPPDVKYSPYFRQFAREARGNQIGLWKFGGKGTTTGDFDFIR
ncbi:thermonuclease family protein [Mesobacillus maritimus]|uniref:thermonuclease family protein n=1 Tax=Mesobacillus maritimus TaxID=1643336 RepID=UPI00203CE4A0|nr:thermonuclease family protein [Mesobacillus maritimus]MCM3671237.1 thermonuclease family protein [Mesobacillus maritimus]